jgi:hypothetical protein
VHDRKVRIDGPELLGLVEQFLLGAVHVGGHELQHGGGQTSGQLILEDVDAVGRGREVAPNDPLLQLLDMQARRLWSPYWPGAFPPNKMI